MKQFDVTGMSCAACSARVEKAVSAVEGVESGMVIEVFQKGYKRGKRIIRFAMVKTAN